MKKYVITGGPGIGKTTVIELLATRGYRIVPESARLVIEQEKAKKSDALPWINVIKFQQVVADWQVAQEERTSANVVFLDRGLIDGHAYCTFYGVTPPAVIQQVGRGRYEKVFILDPLEYYENDSVHLESREDATKIHEAIATAYKFFGYDCLRVPVGPPEERVDFIMERL